MFVNFEILHYMCKGCIIDVFIPTTMKGNDMENQTKLIVKSQGTHPQYNILKEDCYGDFMRQYYCTRKLLHSYLVQETLN